MAALAQARPRTGWRRIALAVIVAFAALRASAAPPPVIAVTADLIAAATAEGKADPESQERETETIKRRYAEYFGI